jgi:hypothetical protein
LGVHRQETRGNDGKIEHVPGVQEIPPRSLAMGRHLDDHLGHEDPYDQLIEEMDDIPVPRGELLVGLDAHEDTRKNDHKSDAVLKP